MRIGMKISPLTVLKAGIPNYILHLLKALAEIDKVNEYFLYTNNPVTMDLNLPDSFTTVEVTFPSPHLQLWYQIGLPLRMRKDALDLFHDPVYPLPFNLPVPGVITVHDLSNYTNPGVHKFRSVLSGKFFPQHLRKARRILTVSNYTASELIRLFPWTSDKIDVVYSGISSRFRPETRMSFRESIREQYGLPDRFFLFLGTLEPRKNLSRLLDAFSLSCSGIPQSLVITGGLGWKYGKLLEMISDHPNRDRIHLTGFISDDHLPALLTSAEFLIYPSILEGFGFPVLEAMACGTPVITSNVTSMPEIAGDAAYLIDPYSTESIADGIRALSRDDHLREELSGKGLARVRSFSWKETARQTLEVYKKVIL